MVEVLGVGYGLGYLHRDGCVCAGCAEMSVSKEKFVRDMMRAQDAKRFAEKEAEAVRIIEGCDGRRSHEEISVYEGYMHNKRYGKRAKFTKRQYQC